MRKFLIGVFVLFFFVDLFFLLFYINQSKPGQIYAVSEIKDYNLKINDNIELKKYINKWRIWNDGVTINNSTELVHVIPKNIVFHLTSKPQQYNVFYSTSKVSSTAKLVLSTGYSLRQDKTVDLYIQVADINLYTSNMKKLQTIFDTLTLTTLYQISHKETNNHRQNIVYENLYKERINKSLIFSIVHD